MKLKRMSKGHKKVALKLESVYAGRLYEEVDGELESIMAFKSGSKPLSPKSEGF